MRALIVDDEPTVCLLLSRILAMTGSAVHRPHALEHVLLEIEGVAALGRESPKSRVDRPRLGGVALQELFRPLCCGRAGQRQDKRCPAARPTESLHGAVLPWPTSA